MLRPPYGDKARKLINGMIKNKDLFRFRGRVRYFDARGPFLRRAKRG